MQGMETIFGAALETAMRQAATAALVASVGAALLLTAAWALAGILKPGR